MFLVFDIGGTNMRVGMAQGGEVKDVQEFETPDSFEEAVEKIRQVLPSLTHGQKVEAGTLGIRGVLNKAKTVLERDNLLTGWVNQPLKDKVQEIIEAPFFLENDAALNGLGEAVYGSGKGQSIVGFLTMGTGVGGSRIVNGRIDENSLGFEPGKQIIDVKNQITLENLISGKALQEKFGERAEEIEDEEIWDEVAKNLAVGLNNLAVLWSPDVIVLGGSVAKSIPLEKSVEYLEQILTVYPTPPQVKRANLGDLSGLYGGLALLNQKSQ